MKTAEEILSMDVDKLRRLVAGQQAELLGHKAIIAGQDRQDRFKYENLLRDVLKARRIKNEVAKEIRSLWAVDKPSSGQ